MARVLLYQSVKNHPLGGPAAHLNWEPAAERYFKPMAVGLGCRNAPQPFFCTPQNTRSETESGIRSDSKTLDTNGRVNMSQSIGKANHTIAAIGLAIISVISTACWETHTYSPHVEEAIEIGALVSLSGPNSAAGQVHLAAMRCALEDVHADLELLGLDFRLNLSDTQSDPYAASVLMNTSLLQGVRVVVGPYTSAEVAAVEQIIGDSESLLISPSSTSLYLANRNDHIFRLAPNDSHMARDLVDLIRNHGHESLVLVYRDDPWGISVADEVERAFTARGGTIVSMHAYDPNGQDDIGAVLRNVQAGVDAAAEGGSLSGVAIQLTSMGEGAQFLSMASDSIPRLRNVRWYGSDGFVGDWSIFGDAEVADFAVDVAYTAPTYRVTVPDRFWHVIERIVERTGVTPGPYSLLTYDATRIAALTLAQAGSNASYEELETTLTAILDEYIGVSGWIEMDVMGDRYDGHYDFYTVRTDGWDYWWEVVDPAGRRTLPGRE